MKMKPFLPLVLILAASLGCSLFSKQPPPTSEAQPTNDTNDNTPSQGRSTEGWLLSDPTVGLDGLDSYHQELTISFQGKIDGKDSEWADSYRRNVWKEQSANFLVQTTSETGKEPIEILRGKVGQAGYVRIGAETPCQVSWREAKPEEDTETERPLEPARLLPLVSEAKEAGTETINDVPARHYTISKDKSGTKVAGDLWLAESGGYVVRYLWTVSGEDGEQRLEYNLSQVNSTREVVYPEDCVVVLTDFPVMDGARNLHRLPNAVDYTVSAETSAISKFYQDKLVAQGWTFVNAHDKDPKNVILIFINNEQGKAASILLSAREKGVWVSAILRPRESSSSGTPTP
jgi:hypothetical protein